MDKKAIVYIIFNSEKYSFVLFRVGSLTCVSRGHKKLKKLTTRYFHLIGVSNNILSLWGHGVVGLEHSSCTGAVSTHHCRALNKSFIPSLLVWLVTKINTLAEKRKNKKNNGEQSDIWDLEQVTLKPQLQLHHYYGKIVPERGRLRKAEQLIRRLTRGIGEIN